MYAAGTRAKGICDRCGFMYPLRKLKEEDEAGKRTGLLVCPTCWSPSHPQLDLGKYPIDDPQALRNPRPDTAERATSRATVIPVYGVQCFGQVGKVEVST